MPYSLKGNSVVRSDTGAVVKTHSSREKAMAHLRALKANVEEGAGAAVLGALLEGFDPAKHPRGEHGQWARVSLRSITPGPRHSRAWAISRNGKPTQEKILQRKSGEYVHSLGARGVTTARLGPDDVRELGLPGAHASGDGKPSMADRRREQADIETRRRRLLDPSAPAVRPYKPPTEAALRQAEKYGLEFGAQPARQGLPLPFPGRRRAMRGR